jgi:hypothetical protein
MSTDLKPNPKTATERFQDHIRDKIRDAIADALPADVLDEMTAQSVKALFYTRAKAKRQKKGGSHWETEEYDEPSFFEEQVLNLATPIVKAEVEKWLGNNQQLLVEMWQKAFDVSVVGYVESLQRSHMQAHMSQALRHTFEELNKERQRENKPPLPTYFL